MAGRPQSGTRTTLKPTIVVLGNVFKVELVDGLECSETGRKLDGDCDFNNRVIHIDRKVKPEVRHSVLAHEYFHALLTLSGQAEGMPKGLEEKLCILSENIAQAWRPR